MSPNKPTLVTPIGELLDRISYRRIAWIIAGVIIGCAIYFGVATPLGHGTKACSLGIVDSLYFSIITFSSLGYGDISPIGFGKIVASLEVLFGLVSIAILVGKLASERQAALLLLIYTSEQQHRITALAKDIRILEKKIEASLTEHNHDRLYKSTKKLYSFISSIHNYLRFQSNEGRLASFGNTSTLRKLYKSIISIQKTVFEALQTSGTQERTYSKLEQTLSRINAIGSVMLEFHTADTETISLLNEIRNEALRVQKWNKAKADGKAVFKFRSEVTEALLDKVKLALPPLPWDRDVYKEVAKKLEIQNKLAERCILELKRRGYGSIPTVDVNVELPSDNL
jgi:hypothetical protein